jgi:hypothetical protein
MVLNELVEKYSLNVISRHTRIASSYLEALLERDCSKLKRVQTFGFISILEREYGVDLSSLRKECKDYFDAYQSQNGGNPKSKKKEVTILSSSEDKKEKAPKDNTKLKSHLNKILLATIVVLVAYGSWQIFVPTALSEEDMNSTVLIENGTDSSDGDGEKVGFFDSVVALFKSVKGDEETAESSPGLTTPQTQSGTNESSKSPKENEDKNRKESKQSDVKVSGGDEVKQKKTPKETQDSIEAKIIEQVREEESNRARQNNRENRADDNLPPISDLISSATAGVDDIVDDSDGEGDDSLNTEVPSMATETTDTETTDNNGDGEEPETTPKPLKPEPEQKPKNSQGRYKIITLHPRSKVWVGYTNLSTMKRKVVIGSDDIDFNLSENNYIVATGHGRVEFIGANGTILKLGDGKKHFFRVGKDGAKEISHEEFQRLNKSKVW